MHAMTIPTHGGPDVFQWSETFPDPEHRKDEVLVKVERTGVNRMDFLVRGGYPGLSLPLPHVCGGDIAGTVAEIGSEAGALESDALERGQRVVVYPLIACGECSLCRSGRPNLCANWKSMGIHKKGGYAQYVAVPAENVFHLPDQVSFDQAVTLPVAGLTAHHAVRSVGQLAAGETLFLWGGGGTIGSMAVAIAKESGVTVITTAGSNERRNTVLQAGADYCLNRNEVDVSEEVRKIAPEGVDAVLDYIGHDTFPTSFSLLKNGGRLLLCGIMTGAAVELNIHQTYFHHRSIHGLFLGSRDDMSRVIDLVAEKRIEPLIHDVMPLSDASEAHRIVASGGNRGKIVLAP